MTTKVEQSIQVDVPVSSVYNQWTQFEDFPHFMGGVREVRQLGDRRLHWVAEIAGVRREWEATILEQDPDRKVAWAATSGATNAGAVRFASLGAGSTMVFLSLEYEPEGVVESVGDKLGIVERQVTSDLERFKKLIEDQGYASGAWRGSVNSGLDVGTPGAQDAASSHGDGGKAGVSGKVLGAAAAVAGAAVVGAAAAASKSDAKEREVESDVVAATPAPAAPRPTPRPAAPAAPTADFDAEEKTAVVADTPHSTTEVADLTQTEGARDTRQA